MNERFQAYSGDKPYIFVSYSHKDAEEVYKIIDQLAEEGYRIWYDQGIPQVSRYSQVIYDHIVGCGLFLVFFTQNSIESQFVLDEVHLARDKNKRIFPVCLDNTALPGELQLRMAAVEMLIRNNHSEYSFQMKLREPLSEFRDLSENTGQVLSADIKPKHIDPAIGERDIETTAKRNTADNAKSVLSEILCISSFLLFFVTLFLNVNTVSIILFFSSYVLAIISAYFVFKYITQESGPFILCVLLLSVMLLIGAVGLYNNFTDIFLS